MKKILAIAFAVCFGLAAGSVGAQQAKKLAAADTVTITGIDTEKMTIDGTDASGNATQVGFDADTRFVAGSETIQSSRLKPGDRIVIEARKEMEGRHDGDKLIADRVLLVVAEVGSSESK